MRKRQRQRRLAPGTCRQHHFDASLVFTLIVMFVAGTLVPFMVMAPKYHVLLPSESAAGLLPGAGVVETLGDFSPQPAIKIVAAITPMMIAFFIKCNAA